ncbi:hypothetical protein Vretimale_688 [Volvox reticuliferus]|uniref:beta-ketoacyl-[acyl-carrier-protein] synthase I n=1 Tax=Volvox reticuliferus TaxID=1737510 RepID=A0A8J4G111_9CHLO|nr:hypothetical protein Vretimale_688 [Volvox reticuliferus]
MASMMVCGACGLRGWLQLASRDGYSNQSDHDTSTGTPRVHVRPACTQCIFRCLLYVVLFANRDETLPVLHDALRSNLSGDAIEQAAILSLFTGDIAAATVAAAHKAVAAGPAGMAAGDAEAEPLDSSGITATTQVAVSSTKGATGHLLGAAGAVEAAFTVLALRDRRAPPTRNLERPDPLLLPGLVGPVSVQLPTDRPIAALCNSFGFGGTNSSLLFATV